MPPCGSGGPAIISRPSVPSRLKPNRISPARTARSRRRMSSPFGVVYCHDEIARATRKVTPAATPPISTICMALRATGAPPCSALSPPTQRWEYVRSRAGRGHSGRGLTTLSGRAGVAWAMPGQARPDSRPRAPHHWPGSGPIRTLEVRRGTAPWCDSTAPHGPRRC
jgi:hypothetical protein